MQKLTKTAAALVLALATLPALAEEPGKMAETAANTLTAPPAAWLGAQPHFVMIGTINGTAFNVQFPDIAAAAGIASFAAKREYLTVEGGFTYIDFEVALEADIGGVERTIEIEMENQDFAKQSLPADFALQEAEFPAGLLSNLETQWEWEVGGASFNEEVLGWTGVVRIESDQGTPDDKGLLGDGMVSGYINAVRGTDTLVISFTAPVTEYEIED
jgi:hypothetical protein